MTRILRTFYLVSVVLLVVLLLSFPTVERGSATYVISVLSAGMLGVVSLGSAALIRLDWDPFEEILE